MGGHPKKGQIGATAASQGWTWCQRAEKGEVHVRESPSLACVNIDPTDDLSGHGEHVV